MPRTTTPFEQRQINDALARQHATLAMAIERLQSALDAIPAPDTDGATWAGVARTAALIDALKRAELT